MQVASCHPVTGALLDDDTAQALLGRDDDTDSSAVGRHDDADSSAVGRDHDTAEQGLVGRDSDTDGDAVGGPDGADTKAGAVAARAATSGEATAADRDVFLAVAAAAGFGGESYRPSTRMAKRIRARDRRCRFPGCSIAAVFCDLDHVRPWPHGRTRDDNLLCLCRRHHRIKQRPGWQVTLAADAVATWTDPTGRIRTTHPVDALRTAILTGTGTGSTGAGCGAGTTGIGTATATATAATATTSTSRARTVIPDGPHSELEFLLEHHGAAPPGHPPTRTPVTLWRDDHGCRHRTDLLPPVGTLVIDPDEPWPQHRARPVARAHDVDLPPF